MYTGTRWRRLVIDRSSWMEGVYLIRHTHKMTIGREVGAGGEVK